MLTSNFSYDEYEYDHYYDYDYDPNLSSIPLEELVVPLLIYSITFTIGLLGNTLILVAVRGQKQVWQLMIDEHFPHKNRYLFLSSELLRTGVLVGWSVC